MELTVKNFRGIERAAITVEPIALVAGPNAAGKSSVAMAAAACLLQTPMPVDGVARNQAGLLLRDGTKRGSATLDGGVGSAAVNWPGGSVSRDPGAPTATTFAAGVESVCGLKPKDATSVLRTYMSVEPSRDDLRAALPAAEVPDAIIDNIWQAIEADGWDAAHRRAKESGTKAKGKWEHITGDNYGSQKALRWVSPLVPSDDGRELDEIRAAVDARTAELEQLIGQQALSDDERQRLEQVAGSAAPQIDAIQIALEVAEEVLEEARQHYTGLSRPVTLKDPLSCPHCGGEVEICGGQVVKFSAEVDHAENVRRAAAISESLTAKQTAEDACLALRQRLVQAEAAHRQIRDAAARLQEFAGRSAGEADIQAARDAVQRERDILIGLEATIQGERVAATIEINKLIVQALDVTGVRQTVLARSLDAFNDRLVDLAECAGWGTVAITADMQVTYDERPYALLSASEQFRCRVTLQLAMAEIDKSAMVVIDAADILDRGGRNSLFRLVTWVGIPALITMTINTAEDVPDLSKPVIGRSYWIEGAVCEDL